MVIAVDFDGTIVTHEYPEIGTPVVGAIETLKCLHENGHKIFLWTMRGNKRYNGRDLLQEAVEYCEDNGITVSYLNEETSFTIEFSRVDRNNEPLDGRINGGIKDRITEGELKILSLLSEHPSMTNKELAKASGKSQRTVSRLLSLLKGKALIKRIG